jgi:hypothetical protein
LSDFYIEEGARGSVFGLKRYDTNRKVAGSNSDEVIGFFSIYQILPAAL